MVKKDKRAGDDLGTLAALYAYDNYPQNFSNHYFGAEIPQGETVPRVVLSVRNIKKKFGGGAVLKWGQYQKWAPDDPKRKENWDLQGVGHGKNLYENWESAVDEAREDLVKLPVDPSADGPDPDSPGDRKRNMLEHLDTAVNIALMRKYMPGMTGADTGIPVQIYVDYQMSHWRRHKVVTQWHPDHLEVSMTCPNGGWIGTALWNKYNYHQRGRVTDYRATYDVPAHPVNHGQILFVFNGAESTPEFTNQPAILQPVLQWTTENGGTWAIRSWYVPASYDPSFSQMPALADVRPFQNPTLPAWTAATPVDVSDRLEGVITWDGARYTSKFLSGGQELARLDAPGISALTYPVAVIEAYMPSQPFRSRPQRLPRTGLVDIDMTRISIATATSNGVPVRPDWDLGKEDPGNPQVEFGTNRLKRYKVKANYGSSPITSLEFKAK